MNAPVQPFLIGEGWIKVLDGNDTARAIFERHVAAARGGLIAPTPQEREQARVAVTALRNAIADPSSMGTRAVMHIDYARPRRVEWLTTWANLPGFVRASGPVYRHALLPGWQYRRSEVVAEMIPDLGALAEHGGRWWAFFDGQQRFPSAHCVLQPVGAV